LKKTLTLVVLAGLMLTGCGANKAAVQPTETATAVAAVVEAVTVPGVMNLTLDKATEQLEDLGFEVKAVDTIDGKSIVLEKNWLVISQDPAEGASVPKGSTVQLGVKSVEKVAAEKAAAEKAAAETAAAEKAAAEAAAAAKAAADKAAADKAAADQAAAKRAAEQAAAQQAAKPAPAPAPVAPAPAPAPAAPAAVPFANCAAAKAAGAAPVYAGTPGYGTHLDRDRDGIGCDK
jgi:hypothetical protein